MSLLSDFLRTLKDDEISSLKKIAFTDREHDAFIKTVWFVAQKNFSDAALQQELKMTKAHFDKMNSVLLDKCYALHTGGEDSKVLYMLWEKGLYDHLLHEARMRERKYVKQQDSKKLANLFRVVFGISLRLPITIRKTEIAEKYGKKYLAELKRPSQEVVFEIEIMTFWNTIFYNSANGNMKDYEPVVTSTLEKWGGRLQGKRYHAVWFFYWLSYASYYEFYTHNFEGWLDSLKNALREFDLCKKDLGDNYKIYVLTKLSSAYCQGNFFRESLQMYRDAFKKYRPQLMRNLYHPLMHSIIAIINHELEEAEEILRADLIPRLDKFPEESLNFDIERTCTILYMQKNDFAKAAYYLQRGQQWDKTQITFLGDILQRMVHNIYFVLTNDLDTATSLLRKNKKFLGSKPQDQMVIEYGKVFMLLNEVIRHKSGKRVMANFETQLQSLQTGIMKLYGDLLNKALKS
ncbi:MAG: hypothetical protein U0T74_06145 [Chitinophagales bacterium]